MFMIPGVSVVVNILWKYDHNIVVAMFYIICYIKSTKCTILISKAKLKVICTICVVVLAVL